MYPFEKESGLSPGTNVNYGNGNEAVMASNNISTMKCLLGQHPQYFTGFDSDSDEEED